MLDEKSIIAIQQSEATNAVGDQLKAALKDNGGTLLAPTTFNLHDLESRLPERRRQRGSMKTKSIDSFAEYAAKNSADGTTVFVDQETMKAAAVLNLGSKDHPGHADNTAEVALEQTAAFAALLAIANGKPNDQGKAAEFFEDWTGQTTFYGEMHGGEGAISPGQAIAAIRKLTIDAARKVESEAQSLSASKSTFESVRATSDNLPTFIYFKAVPYKGLPERVFVLRLGVLTSDDPMIVLRIVKLEEHKEAMADEFAGRVRSALKNSGLTSPVLLGTYSVGK